MEAPSEYIKIIVVAIYAVALFYTIVTFQRSKRLDQITSLSDVMKELRDVDRELTKIPAGSQINIVRSLGYYRMFNSLEWLSFMINEKIITDQKLIAYIKPMITCYYEDQILKFASATEGDSYHYQQFKKPYQSMKGKI
ncbi:MAG: hypothetical protein L0H53_13450 [Candidatus Nitrosocosmicus sp.]|nr:hypothetical protein [Candidatus Nitrosocosmicus sp.]